MLLPKRVKYRKQQRGTSKGNATRGFTKSFGDYALKSISRGVLSSRHIEAARKAISHKTKREGKLWIRVFPSKAVSKKPNETRMGSGKAPADHYVAVIRPGKIIFEISGVSESVAREAFGRASDKLPLSTMFIKDDKN